MTVEGELQDPSARKVKLVAECMYVRRDQAQILDDKRQTAQLTLECLKEIRSWTGNPLSRLCSRCAGGYVPGRSKGTEMIQANHIDVGQQRAQPGDAPTIAGPAKNIPVICGVAPKLSLRAEVVRRNTGNEARPTLLVQQKEFRMCPNVARVGRDEEGQIAD